MQISCRHYLKFYFFLYLSNFLSYLRDQGVYMYVFMVKDQDEKFKIAE